MNIEAQVEGVSMSMAAAEWVAETGTDVAEDVRRMGLGMDPDVLLKECTEGADEDRLDPINEYVSAIIIHVELQGA